MLLRVIQSARSNCDHCYVVEKVSERDPTKIEKVTFREPTKTTFVTLPRSRSAVCSDVGFDVGDHQPVFSYSSRGSYVYVYVFGGCETIGGKVGHMLRQETSRTTKSNLNDAT